MEKIRFGLSKLLIGSLLSLFFTFIPPVVLTKFQPAFANPGGISSAPLLWLDATDIDSNTANPADGATVSRWEDRSSYGNDATVLDGQGAPTYSATSGINNGPAVRFSRSGDWNGTVLEVPNVDIRAGTLESITVFTVYKAEYLADQGGLSALWGNDDGAWDRFAICCGFYGNDRGVIGLPPGGFAVPEAGIGTRLLTVVYSGGITGSGASMTNYGPSLGSSVWFEGGRIHTFTDSTTATDALNSFFIGWDGDNNPFNGWISELIIYPQALSSTDIVEISNYLGNKYNLTIAPTPTTLAATLVETTSATLNGTVNAHNDTTTSITIRYSTDSSTVTNNTATSPTVSPSQAGGNTDVSVSAVITGLSPGTKYWFRVGATNSKGGPNYGALQSFTTPISVTYNTQGGSAISSGSTPPNGTIASSPGTPTRSGYAFAGWFTASDTGSAITFPYSHSQTSNFTLYAQWTQLTHSITFFDSNTASASGADGGNAPASQTGSGVDTVTLNANTLSLSNYNFSGWATSNGSTTVVYSDSATVTITPGLTLSLYPVWTPITYSITYSSGISGQSPYIETITVNRTGNQGFAFSPISGYRIKSVVVNGVSQGAVNSYTFSNVTTNHSLSVEFELIPSSTSSTPTYVPQKSAEQEAAELAAQKLADEKAAEVLATQQKALSDNAAADKTFQSLQDQINSALSNGSTSKSSSTKAPAKTSSSSKSSSSSKVETSKSGLSVPEGTILITPTQIASLEIAKSASGNSANIAISQLKSGQRVKVTVISKADLNSNSIDLGSTQITEVTPNPSSSATTKSPTSIAIKPAPKTSAKTSNQAQVSVTGAKKNQRVRVTIKSK